jgi:hypothetical protein
VRGTTTVRERSSAGCGTHVLVVVVIAVVWWVQNKVGLEMAVEVKGGGN